MRADIILRPEIDLSEAHRVTDELAREIQHLTNMLEVQCDKTDRAISEKLKADMSRKIASIRTAGRIKNIRNLPMDKFGRFIKESDFLQEILSILSE